MKFDLSMVSVLLTAVISLVGFQARSMQTRRRRSESVFLDGAGPDSTHNCMARTPARIWTLKTW
jgi:hypothetical protein